MNEKTKKKILTYLLAFTIPLVIRAIPELKYKYPLGADTPFYMYTIKYSQTPPLINDIWRQNNIYHTLLTHLGKTLYYISFNDHRNPILKYKNINQTKITTYKELALYILNPK